MSNQHVVAAGDPSPAALLGFERSGSQLVFDVISNGCTKETDFILKTKSALLDSGEKRVQLTLMRLQPDRCRRMPQRMRIYRTLPTPMDASSSLFISNPFIELPQRES